MSSRRPVPAVCTAFVLLAAIAFAPSGAAAAQLHSFGSRFGGPGSGAGRLGLVFPGLNAVNHKPESAGSGIAVNDETHDVYVADTGNHRVSQFDPSKPEGEQFVRAFGADVGGPGIDVCTTSCVTGTSGHAPGELESPTFIAVDNSAGASHGDVYVADTAANLVSKFSETGVLQTTWGVGGQLDGSSAPGGPFGAVKGIGDDPAGDLWVQTGSRVYEFDQAAAPAPGFTWTFGSQPTGIALDGAGHIYALDGFPDGPIHRLAIDGSDLGVVFRDLPEGFFTGLAADQSSHDLYADIEGKRVATISVQCDPSKGECTPTEVFGEGRLEKAAGIAVDSSDATVYAAETQADEVFAFPVTLEATVQAPTEVEATTATAHGTVDPKATQVTSCAFQYGTTTSYGTETPCLDASGEEVGTEAHPITTTTALHGALTGLAGGTKYHYRLRVGNEAREFLSSGDEELTTKTLAVIESASASEVTATSATLNAQINPHGLAVSACSFEYGTDSSYGTTVPCEPPTLPAGTAPVPVTAPLTGLSANTTYHFRVSATDANGTTISPDHTLIFLTGTATLTGCPNEGLRAENNSTALPDCRAYELVTPMDKNASLIGALFLFNIPPQISESGVRVIAPAIQCFADSGSCIATRGAEGEPFQFERSSGGWAATSLALPATSFATSSAWRFNADTGAALFGVPSPANEAQDDWIARAAGGALRDLGPIWEEGSPVAVIEIGERVATTADFSHLLYATLTPAWPSFDQGTGESLYAYPGPEGDSSAPQLVAVSGGPGSTDLIGTCGSVLAGDRSFSKYEAMSADGGTVFFNVQGADELAQPCTGHVPPVGELFARIDGARPDARTVSISQPNALSPAPSNPACSSAPCLANTSDEANFRDAGFQGTSADGSKVYFTSPQQLTDSAAQDPNPADSGKTFEGCLHTRGAGGCNLYLYEDPQEQPLTGTHLIDASAGDTSGLGPEVQGMVALSGDGTHAYFVAKGVLTRTPNAQGQGAAEGANNLYLYERDADHAQGRTTFIASLADADKTSWIQGIGFANVTPDGRFLVFESRRGLTPDATPGEGATQIYRYDAEKEELLRVSIGQRGFNDNGNAGGTGAGAAIVLAAQTIVARSGPVRSDPTMSHDGSYVFFQSPVALTPGALDEVPAGAGGQSGTALAQNIYEWEAPGTEVDGRLSCTEPSGCVSLISSGTDTAESGKNIPNVVELLGTDASGENVFFATASQLNWADTDSQRDYYDARVNGGFAKPAEASICSGDACKGPGTGAGAESSPVTPSVNGPGNVRPAAKCKKGFVKKHGKCVKKHQKKKAKHHKKSKKRHAKSNRGAAR